MEYINAKMQKNANSQSVFEVLQVYVSFPDGAGEPPRNLRAFREVAVPCGDAEKGDVAGVSVEIELEQRAFEVWSNKAWPV